MGIFRSAWLVRLLFLLPVPGVPLMVAGRINKSKLQAIVARLQYVLVQAYGRGSYLDKTLHDELVRVMGADWRDLPACFRKLQAAGFKPGRANRALASICRRLWRLNPSLVLIMQWEVAYCLWEDMGTEFEASLDRVDCIWPEGSYFATKHVKEASAEFVRKRGLDPDAGIELAHSDMAARAMMIIWKIGLDPYLLIAPVPFDPESVQRWVRNPLWWFVRESLGRAHHIRHGWLAYRRPRPNVSRRYR